MNYQSVQVTYYPPLGDDDQITIALFRGTYDNLPDGVELHRDMTRDALIARFAAAQWEVIEPDDGESIVFARLLYGENVIWPSKQLHGQRAMTKPTVTHHLGVPREMARPVTVMKRNYKADTIRSILDNIPPQDQEPYATLEHLYPHERSFMVWHSERVEIDSERMIITDYGWYEVFVSYVWTTSQTPPKEGE